MNTLVRSKERLIKMYTNLRGWRTKRRLLVIESDDWGALRIPSRTAHCKLTAAGIYLDSSPYDHLDCLESRNDFQALMNVIDSHRDASGRPAKFTFNTVMGNPDFEAIEQDNFKAFHHQHFFDSYRAYHGQDLEEDWRKAMTDHLIRPQFHAREHLNSPLWMADLRAGHEETRLAFNHKFYAHNARTGSLRQKNYLCAYWPETPEALEIIECILDDGLGKFNETFGFCSLSFVGCNYVWPEALERHLAERGVKGLQTQRARLEPDPDRDGATHVRRHYTGQKNRRGQLYSVRNVVFEPFSNGKNDSAARALAEVSQAFQFHKPAIVCSHRVNYVGGMNMHHRDQSLKQLAKFLGDVRQRWPDVEFISSDELINMMEAESR
mgnify:CR=1 FL=1